MPKVLLFVRPTGGGGGGGEETDPYGEYVSLLTHFDQGAFLTDSSLNNLTVTSFGNASFSTSVKKFGSGAAFFDGNGDYLTFQASEAFNYGSGDFTIEFWVKPLNGPYGTYNPCFFTNHSNGEWNLTGKGIRIHHQNAIFSTGQVNFVVLNFANQIQNNTWNHLAIVRNGNTITAYLNGVNNGSVSFMGSLGDSSDSIGIALSDTLVPGGREFLNGYIDELRITKGIARYTSNFTLPTAAFPNPTVSTDPYGSNVSLLLHADGAEDSPVFTDSSLNNLSVTATGNARIKTGTKKFGSGAAYFDGSSGHLSAGFSSGLQFAGDFTVEMWYYPSSLSVNQCLYDASLAGQLSSRADAFALAVDASGQLFFFHAGAPTYASSHPSINQWNHIAISRSGSSLKVFLNGNSVINLSNSVNFSRGGMLVGTITETIGAYAINGYVDDLRITKGVARYTANFTPPTAAFPNPTAPTDPYGSNVSLLLHADGAEDSPVFTDSSLNNLSITAIGNARVKTGTKKFGSGAAYFDGDADYLNISTSPQFGFGTGDFTIEAWVYPTALQSDIVAVVDLRSSGGSNGVGLFIGASYVPNKIFFYDGSNNTAVITDTEVLLNTWTHIVGQRRNGEWSVYINGVKDAQIINSLGDVTSSRPCFIGTACDQPGAFRNFTGYIDEIRITKGVARYTANFTPPTAAFPNP